MFFDARQFEQGHTIDVVICVIGAGADGITAARELIGSTSRVALIE